MQLQTRQNICMLFEWTCRLKNEKYRKKKGKTHTTNIINQTRLNFIYYYNILTN